MKQIIYSSIIHNFSSVVLNDCNRDKSFTGTFSLAVVEVNATVAIPSIAIESTFLSLTYSDPVQISMSPRGSPSPILRSDRVLGVHTWSLASSQRGRNAGSDEI